MTAALSSFRWQQEQPTRPEATVSANFLGPFSVTVLGCEVSRWRAGKARNFFQYLTVHRGQVIPRDRLNTVLWPEAEWGPGASSLKVACHAARAAVGAARTFAEPSESGIQLVHREVGYLIRFQSLWCDLEEFQELVRRGLRRWAAGDRPGAVADLAAATHLYQGDFLCGEQGDWIEEYREHYKSLALRSLDVLRADATARDDSSEAGRLSLRILDIDPHHEPTYQALIREHGRLGEPERARSWYQLCARRLARDFGVDPAPETRRALQHAIATGHQAPRGHRPVEGRGTP